MANTVFTNGTTLSSLLQQKMKQKNRTCDGENGSICSDCSFCGVAQESVLVFETWVQLLLTNTDGLAEDVLAELFGWWTTDFFFFLRRRRMHGVFVSLDFIFIDRHVGVNCWVTATWLSSSGQGSKAPRGLSPSWKPAQTNELQQYTTAVITHHNKVTTKDVNESRKKFLCFRI